MGHHCDGELKYTPKVGDRVRATLVYEGIVKSIPESGQVHVRLDLDGHDHPLAPDNRRYLDQQIWEFEKLATPEPEWVNGDVIEVVYHRTDPANPEWPRAFARVDDRWVAVETGETPGSWFMYNHWPKNVKILYKADQQDAAVA